MNALDCQAYQSPASSTVRTLEFLFTKYSHLLDATAEHTVTLKTTDLRRMSDKDKADALTMHNEQVPPQVIANRLGFSCAAITGFLHRAGARQRLTKANASEQPQRQNANRHRHFTP
jgi:hypothetical protein